ncbi:nuclear transport factor 2 family protein [Pseudomonas chlororaphis]|uniref:Steroid delta-isomerase domain protein n=1 Tax=Pseudomonas chlororaphis TaxID=587753 RepID=A0AAX3FX85_9PSED|nr:nuclear transport factor 2 family protein [Pseudomonas chlororaphis]AZC39635.1 Steroid delta-isomerase domain protein [Pseudomonas chlororaphis subsp. piscium]AZC46186.1 Steroid delta-isomerase domain protein [Pseudomonas chlororaphis subsp. piscium]QTT84348.1 nuclear transport factor 2 family protein [Pseudomonas chlororaphis]WDG71711.1 nuclear transport factor 2 family protein [Pseudomonas chlororaphis]WDH30506.1 nuclear transport factor 2 family protein [Pseudomonas chlororaphis]
MSDDLSAQAVVQRQLEAYNRRDLEAWLATYAEDACQYGHPATLLASGHAEIRARAVERFQESNLHARLLSRAVMGQVVIDHEMVTRTFAEGPGTLETVAIYEVEAGRIKTASFTTGPRTLD